VDRIHTQYFSEFTITKIREDLPFAMLVGPDSNYIVECPKPLVIPSYFHGVPVKAI
jgi:hypothetical protein